MAEAKDTQCNKRNGPSDEGHSLMADLLTAAAITAAAYNSAKAVEIATDQWKMAKKYWQISKNWLDHYKKFYAPLEDKEINEALALKDPEPEYDTARGRSRTIAHILFKGAVKKNVQCLSEYCTGLRQDMLTDLLAAQGMALAMADGLGYRNERAYIDSRSDIRFDKQLNTAKRGRDMIADNVSLAQATAKAYGDAFGQAWEGLKGAAYYLGYEHERVQPSYPTTYVSAGNPTYPDGVRPREVPSDPYWDRNADWSGGNRMHL